MDGHIYQGRSPLRADEASVADPHKRELRDTWPANSNRGSLVLLYESIGGWISRKTAHRIAPIKRLRAALQTVSYSNCAELQNWALGHGFTTSIGGGAANEAYGVNLAIMQS